MDNPIKKILDSVKTKEELDILKRGLVLLEQSLYKNGGGGIEDVLRSELPRDTAVALRAVLFSDSYKGNPEKVGFFLVDLKKEIVRLRVLGLDLAFYPSEKTLEILTSWVGREVGEGIILDLNIDRGVIGGARFVFGGRFSDYSLGRMIEEAMAEERERILGMVIPKIKIEAEKVRDGAVQQI